MQVDAVGETGQRLRLFAALNELADLVAVRNLQYIKVQRALNKEYAQDNEESL